MTCATIYDSTWEPLETVEDLTYCRITDTDITLRRGRWEWKVKAGELNVVIFDKKAN